MGVYRAYLKCLLKCGTSFALQLPEQTAVAAAEECHSALHLHMNNCHGLSINQWGGRYKAPTTLMLQQC